jgi:PAS domain S-box-containing protein
LFAGAARRSAFQKYALAVVLPLMAFAVTAMFADLPQAPFFSLFSLSVVVTAIVGGIRPGLVATAASMLCSVLSVYPPFSPDRPDPNDLVRIAAFAVIATTIAVLIGAAGELQNRLDIERRRLDITLRSIGDAVIATDARGRVVFMNKAAEKATGYKQGEAVGRFMRDIFHIVNEQTRAPLENPADRVLGSGNVVGLANHTLLIRKDGSEIPIDDSAAPIVSEGVLTGVVMVFRDVSEERLKEAALLRAEKLASVGRLAATIAHEINNPLESVTNLLFLIGSSDDLASVKSLAEAAQMELARAAHVSRQTLSFAHHVGPREPANLPTLIDGIIGLYTNRLHSKSIELVKSYRGDGTALASPSEVRQVISNLLGNAIDAERNGGRIDIRVHPCTQRKFVRLVVADRGCGMSPGQMRRMFEPFFTTKQDVGTGLGLWVTKQIVDSHGGTIRSRSRVGYGTVVVVNWPVREVAQANEAAAALD